MGGVDELNLVPILDLAEQPVTLLLKVCKLFATPQTLQLSSFTMKKVSVRLLNHIQTNWWTITIL